MQRNMPDATLDELDADCLHGNDDRSLFPVLRKAIPVLSVSCGNS